MPEEFVTFVNKRQRLAGMLHVPEGRHPHPAVVLCHGFTGQRIEAHCLFVKMARRLCAHGLHALRIDFRGSGESEGRFEDMTVSGEISDALAALEFARQQPTADPERVALLGLSLGGCVAACAAGRDGGVRALALWAATAEPHRIGAAVAPQPDGTMDFGGNVLGPAFTEDVQAIDPLAEVGQYGGPALVVHGAADEVVPVDHAHRYMDALATTDKRLLVVEGADHTFARADWEAQVITETAQWLAQRLK